MEPRARRPLVLIADDNRDLAKGLSILLNGSGFDVDVVHDGREVLAAAHVRKPDVFLLDIGLPGMDGCEVAARIRKDQELKESLIIAMSAYDDLLFPEASPSLNFDYHLPKPFNWATILSLIVGGAEKAK
jgi:CheY-like chemotaxis protein